MSPRTQRILLAVAVVGVVAAALVWWALGSETVHRALLAKVSSGLEESAGLTLEVETLRVRPLAGSLELGGVAVRNLDGGELASARSARATIRLRPLLRRRLVATEVAIESLRVDLAALPERGPEPEAEPAPPAVPPIEVHRLRLADGRLAGVPLPGGAEVWSPHGAIEEIELEGSLARGRLEVTLARAAVGLARAGQEPARLTVAGRLAGPLAGPFALDGVEVRGPDLEIDAAGTLGVSAEQPMTISFRGGGDAGSLIDPRYPARLAAAGEIDLRSAGGRVELDAPAVPAELLARWLEPDLFERLGAAETTIGVRADLRLGPEGLDRLSGTLDGTWSRGEQVLVELGTTPDLAAAERRARVPFTIAVTPALAGARRASGTLSLGDWQDPAGASLEDGRLELRLPDLAASLATHARLFPILAGKLPAELAGALEVAGSVSGPVASPTVDARGEWRPSAGSRLLAEAAGAPLERRGRLAVRAEALSLETVGAPVGGVVDGRLELAGTGSGWSGSFDVAGKQIATGEAAPVDLVARGTVRPDSIVFSELSGDWGEHRLDAAVVADLTADGLRVVAEPLTVDGVTGEASVEVPGALLAGLPVIGSRPWSSAGARGRRVRVAWDVPDAEPPATLPFGRGRLELATRGELTVDLERPQLAQGEIALTRLRWLGGDQTLGLERAVRLELEGGRLAADRLALVADDSRLDASVEVILSDAWGRGDEVGSLLVSGGIDGRAEIGSDWIGQALGVAAFTDRLVVDTDLRADRASISGRLDLEGAGSRLAVRGSAKLAEGAAVQAVDVAADGTLSAVWIATVFGVDGVESGALELDVTMSGDLAQLAARARVDGTGTAWPLGGAVMADPRIDLELAESELTLHELTASVNGEPLAGNGSARTAPGRFELDRLELSFAGIESVLAASLPVAAEDPAEAWATVDWRVAEADLHPALELLGLIAPGDVIRAGTTGNLYWTPAGPAEARGVVEITGLDWISRGRRTSSDGPIRLRIAGGEAILEPLRLLSADQVFELRGDAILARSWTREQELGSLIERLEVTGDGTLLTSLLNPFLAGAVADGYLEVELQAAGPPTDLAARVRVRGDQASLIYARPYATRISEPALELVLEPGGGYQLDGTLRLNEGLVGLSGGSGPEGRTALTAELAGVRYRLDYAMLTLLNGRLELRQRTDSEWLLSGTIELENGVLTRDMDLDLDFLLALLAPVDLTSTEESPLEAFKLDLELTTVEGVRVKNNVADLLVRWDPVRITGTLAVPVVGGRFDIEPGGRVRAFGQTVRVDQASIDYPGVPDLPATMEMDITSSFEDPSIASLAADDPFRSERDPLSTDEQSRLESAATGLGAYYGERLASRLTAGANGARVSLEPLLIFGEADPGARLTVSQDFSPQVTLAASIDLRNAEAQTYLLDFHGLDAVPGLNAQVFTTDEESRGGAVRQRVKLGPGGAPKATGPRIRKIRFELPERVSKRRLKRAVGLGKGDRLGDGDRFAAEVEVAEALRRRGYSEARASVEVRELDNGVEIVVSARPGPRAEFVFGGPRLTKALRRSITDLYRSDYYEALALEEMEAEARRALRSRGFLDPEVEVQVELRDPDDLASDRRVIVAMTGGRRIDLERVRFVPLPSDEEALLATRFSRPVRRIELAAGVPDADRRVEQTLRYVGYAEPRVVGRRLSEDGQELEVTVETGERPRLGSVRVAGVEAEEAERLAELAGLGEDEPLRPDLVAAAAVKLRDDLRLRGYADASVEPRFEPLDPSPGTEAAVIFDVEPGTSYFIGEVTFDGLETTRPKVASRVADLELEQDYSQKGVLDARRRLWKMNLFDTVTPDVVRAPGGAVRVEFDVQERKPFEIAYGVRWESEDELGLLAEAIDRNTFGRGWTTGLRAQWAEDEQSLRGFAGLPRFLSPRNSLGLFAAVREQTEGGLITDTIEGTAQLSWELSRRLTARVYGQITESHVTEEDPDPFFPFDVRLTRPILGSQVLYDSRRGRTLYERGLLATGDLSISDGAFGSDFDYVRFFGQVNMFRPIRSDGSLVWAQAVRLGLAEAYDGDLVRLDRFFAGGAFSVRGYLSESLGPQEDLGLVVRPAGGEALVVINQELRWTMTEELTGLVFVDAGQVWAKLGDIDTDLATSIGLGLRALTPIGILRLDLAHALDRRPIDPEFKIYFGLGSTF